MLEVVDEPVVERQRGTARSPALPARGGRTRRTRAARSPSAGAGGYGGRRRAAARTEGSGRRAPSPRRHRGRRGRAGGGGRGPCRYLGNAFGADRRRLGMEPVVSLIETPAALDPTSAGLGCARRRGRPAVLRSGLDAVVVAPRGAAQGVAAGDRHDRGGGARRGRAVLRRRAPRSGTVYRMLGVGRSRRATEPLALPGREEEAAVAFARALAAATPRPAALSFHQISPDSPWPELLRRQWPGRAPRVLHEGWVAAPTIRLAGRELRRLHGVARSRSSGKAAP